MAEIRALSRLAAAVVARPRRTLLLWGLALAAALPGLTRLEIDNSPAGYYLERSAERAAFARFEERFGTGEAVRVVLSGERLFTPAGVAFLAALERDLAAVDGVVGVDGPVGRHRRALADPPDPAALRSRLQASAVDRALGLVGRDGGDGGDHSAVSILATLAPGDGAARRAQVAQLEALAAGTPSGVDAEVAGFARLQLALDEASRSVLRLLPVLAPLTLLYLFVTFREPLAVAVPFLHVLAVGILVFGGMGLAGVRIDLVIAVLPPVLFSIALAQAVHLLLHLRAGAAANDDEPPGATLRTYREKGRALAGTALSTVAGFGALAATPVGPIRTLGLWGAGAMLVAGLAAVTLYPVLLAFAERRRAHAARLPERALELRLERFGHAVAEGAVARRRLILTLAALVALVALAGLRLLRVESDALSYFPADHPVKRSVARAESLGMGLATVELVGEAQGAASFGDAAGLAALAALGERLRAQPGAISALSAADVLDEVGAASPLARAFSAAELRERLLPLVAADADGARALARLLPGDATVARVTLFVPVAGYDRIDPLAAGALAAARAEAPFARWSATGQLPLLLATQHRLLDTLFGSLAWALPMLGLVFLFLLGRFRATLAALVPNVWPVAVLLGTMGWLGVPIDIATVMVASIVAGLVVDDTIHTLAPFRERAAEIGALRAITERVEKSAPAFLLTSAILVSGFAVCITSDFAPIARFGALSVMAIAIALFADLLLVPALFGRPGAER